MDGVRVDEDDVAAIVCGFFNTFAAIEMFPLQILSKVVIYNISLCEHAQMGISYVTLLRFLTKLKFRSIFALISIFRAHKQIHCFNNTYWRRTCHHWIENYTFAYMEMELCALCANLHFCMLTHQRDASIKNRILPDSKRRHSQNSVEDKFICRTAARSSKCVHGYVSIFDSVQSHSIRPRFLSLITKFIWWNFE